MFLLFFAFKDSRLRALADSFKLRSIFNARRCTFIAALCWICDSQDFLAR